MADRLLRKADIAAMLATNADMAASIFKTFVKDIGMDNYSELAIAIRREREAEKLLEECLRRTNELAGLVSEKEQRKKSPRSAKEFNKACGI